MTAAAAHSLLTSPSGAPAGGQPSAGVSCDPLRIARDPSATWIPLSQLYGAFEGEPETQRQSASRWVRKLPSTHAKQEGRSWLVLATARFKNTLTVQAYLHAGRSAMRVGPEYPPDCEWWNAGDSQRYLDTIELIERWNAFRTRYDGGSAAMSVLDAFSAAAWEADLPLTVGEWAAARGLTLAERSLRRYAERIKPGGPRFDGNVDRRGKHKVKGVDQGSCSAAWDFFKVLWLDPNRPSIRICWEMTRVQARRESRGSDGWQWPALRTVQRWVEDELPAPISDLHRRGEKRWEKEHAPRMREDHRIYRPNQMWVGDHHRFDVIVLGPKGPVRPWLTGWLDKRSRMLVGWCITLNPASDTILQAFSVGAIKYGLPDEVKVDNGKDYRAYWLSGGKGRKVSKDWQPFDPRVATVFGRAQVEARFAKPYNPQSKLIESFFGNKLKVEFSRLFESYCGGKPDERPETLYAEMRSKGIVPPLLPDFEAAFARWVEERYHQETHGGDAMDGLCPAAAFEINPIAKRTASERFLKDIMTKRVPATVTKRGVCIGNGIYYGHANLDLMKHRGSKVLLGINPVDASAVEVYDIDGNRITTATNDQLIGLTPELIKQGAKQKQNAKRFAAKALPAVRDSRKSTVDHALDLLAEAAVDEPTHLRATGTDATRPLKLVASAAGLGAGPGAGPGAGLGAGLGGTGVPPVPSVTPARPQPHYFDIEETNFVFDAPAHAASAEGDGMDALERSVFGHDD